MFKELQLPLTQEDLSIEKDWSKHLSLGEQQRLILIRAVLAHPKWLFLDEAMASLDSQSESQARAFLAKYLPDSSVIEIAHHADSVNNDLMQF